MRGGKTDRSRRPRGQGKEANPGSGARSMEISAPAENWALYDSFPFPHPSFSAPVTEANSNPLRKERKVKKKKILPNYMACFSQVFWFQ